jgi:hypothetical protein
MVMTKMPPRLPSKKRAHRVLAKPENFDAKKGKRMKLLSDGEDSDSLLLSDLLSPKHTGQLDPRRNVEMRSQNSGPSEHSEHSSQQQDNS